MDAKALAEFRSLPVNPNESWQGGVAEVAELMGIPPEESPTRMSLILWRCVPSELVHARPIVPDGGSPFEQFVDAMLELSEEHDFLYRPSRIDCNDQRLAEELNQQLDGSGTVVHFRAKMGAWNAIIRDLADYLMSAVPPRLPSLREAGCTDEQIGQFAATAADFYRARLWELIDDTDLIKFETPKPPPNLKYAVVLDAGSQSYGLGFYNDAEDHYALMAQQADPRQLSLFSFVYESPADVASGDVDLWKELDLPLETGEAFPDANLFTPDGLRRPTPKEVDFLTIVLQGLAQTSEEELDSGRWSKWIDVSGRRKKCVFSIPNLLDPPNRAEWIRRGKMPDLRSHEVHFKQVQEFIETSGQGMSLEKLNGAISVRFTGRSLDDSQLPRNTAAERAEALCQDALESFGRRRVLLAREALAEDPSHVEASILLAESTRAVDRRIEVFRNAQRAAEAALGTDMDQLAGNFWGFHETRPYMRACHGLAVALAEAGQASDAIEQYREMLQLNPNDNQGVRYEIVPLLLEQDRDAEAIAVLDEYPEESALWLHLKALVKFRRSARSATSKKALRAAFKANAHVLTLMQSDEPPLMPESYSLGSPEEAAICIRELETTWDETEGYLEWMFQEFFSWEKERAKRLRDQKRRKRKQSDKRKRRR